jgi:hypothetical protein
MSKRERIKDSVSMAVAGILFAPSSFKKSSISSLELICNGCGAANAKFDFVPDRIYGTSISAACSIHDFMYHEGQTIEDKEEADRVFRNNMYRLVDIDCKLKWYKPKFLMRKRVQVYYKMVDCFGGSAFWAGK